MGTLSLESSTGCRHRGWTMVSLLFGRVQGIAAFKNFQPLQKLSTLPNSFNPCKNLSRTEFCQSRHRLWPMSPVARKRLMVKDVAGEWSQEGEGAGGEGDQDVGRLGGEDSEGDLQGGRGERRWRRTCGRGLDSSSTSQPHTGQRLGWRNMGRLLLWLWCWWTPGRPFLETFFVFSCMFSSSCCWAGTLSSLYKDI